MADDRNVTWREISHTVGMSIGTEDEILREKLGMSRVCSHWIPHILTAEQIQQRIQTSQALVDRLMKEGRAMLQRLVTGDETWVYYFDQETKMLTSVWKTPEEKQPVKARTNRTEKR